MKRLMLVCGVMVALTSMAAASDIAFYTGEPNPGWYINTAMAADVTKIISQTGSLFGDVQKFDDAHLTDFGAWVDARTNDGKMDIIWLPGTIPSVLYPYPNLQPDGSRAEKWLDGGNMIINVGDWFAYCSYEINATRQADNGGAGAANILDLNAGVIVSADNTALQVTPAGKKYLPSVTNPIDSDRPIALSAVVAPWEVVAIFGSTGGTEALTESRGDPIVIHNKVTGAYVAFINQANPGFPDRGQVCAEFIRNWVATVIGLGSPAAAGGGQPADGSSDVPRDTALSWTAGVYPATHDVYLGTTFADVNSASRTDAKGVLAGKGQADPTFDPPGSLAYGQTYYWRIDEVNKSPDGTIAKGKVWSFTVEPYGYPVKPVKATASSYQASMGPEKTMDGSGLDKNDLHGTEPTTMWMTSGAPPNWIQYEFDKVYKLYQLQVWNSNQLIEGFLGFGAKKVTIETSVDGTTWTPLADVPEFAKATGMAGYAANTTVKFGGVNAKFVKLTINTNQGGMAPQTGLAEVRFFYVPVQARAPQPATGATGVSLETSLTWKPGREAGSHKVFFGTDPNAVAKGTAPAKDTTDRSYTPDALNLETTYYWRVDEVNTVTYPGDVWSFATETFKVVDDFERYTDKAGEEVFSTWIDGLADNYKSSGSTVGLDTAKAGTFCETTIIHGGKQSMPLAYDNTKAPVSEATLTFAPARNWTASGIKSLSLWFQGVAGNGGQLYVKINNTKVSYNGAAGDLAKTIWTPWNIDLSTTGANLSKVTSLTIGIEGAGAKGLLYIDDIRLYPKAPAYITPVDPGKTNLVGLWTFDGNANDTSGKGNNGTVTGGTAQWVPGMVNQALQFNGGPLYVDCGTGASLNLTDAVTVTAWIKMDFTAGDRKIAATQDGVAGGYKLGLYSNNKLEFEIRTAANASTLNRASAGGTVLQQGVWYHVAGVYSKGQFIRTYVLGNLDRELLTTAVLGPTAGSFKIGRGESATTYFWLGALDDVQVYNKALSQEELLWLAGQKTPVAKPF